MTAWLERLWYPSRGAGIGLWHALALRMLLPMSWLFTFVAKRRRLRLTQLAAPPPVPTLIVGNLTVGGTGKTPLVIALIRRLQADGFRIGVISRGYGGRPQGNVSYPLSVSQYPNAIMVGDEPLLIHDATGVAVFVDPDRTRARAALLQAQACDVVISDDGLQHYALSRTFELAVIDSKRGLGNGHCLPAGPLREPPSRLAEVDAIVINQGTTGATESSAPAAVGPADVLTRTLAPLGERCCSMSLVTEDIRALHEAGSRSDRLSSSPRPGETITAVAGIGNPARFFDTLRVLGYQVIEQPFPDHHEFQPADFQTLKGPIIMTEKDAVKCRRILPAETGQFWVLAVTAVLPDAFYQSVVRHLLGVEAPGMR